MSSAKSNRIHNGEVRFITGDNQGKKAWWYLEVPKLKWPLYERAVKGAKSLSLGQYGNVLKSGWGELPPQSVQDEMEEKFGVKVAA